MGLSEEGVAIWTLLSPSLPLSLYLFFSLWIRRWVGTQTDKNNQMSYPLSRREMPSLAR